MFATAAADTPLGRRAIREKLRPMFCLVADENGEVDPDELQEMIKAGISKAGKIPVLMGLISIGSDDVTDSFRSL